MKRRSSGTSTWLGNLPVNELWLVFNRFSRTSAMATSLIGGPLTERALAAAPVPRPPQPTSATLVVLSSAAWTKGIWMPASAETAAVVLRKRRREGSAGRESFMTVG